MTFAHTTSLPWSLPGCPTPPAWSIDWKVVLARYPWLLDLADTRQNPHYHAEGDVLTHTRMVAAALVALPGKRLCQPRVPSCSRQRCCTISPSQSAPRLTARAASARRAMPLRVSGWRVRSYGAMR